MSITPAAARTAVQAANSAGKQLTLTLNHQTINGDSTLTGTARFPLPSDPNPTAIVLFGANVVDTGWGSFGGVAADPIRPAVWVSIVDVVSTSNSSLAVDATLGTVLRTADSNRFPVGYGSTNWTTSQPVTSRVPDPTWAYGTGLE
jgi:hypothetical protein